MLLIDKADNGIAQNLLSQSIKAMNPCWNTNETEDQAFARALSIAIPILKATVDHANASVEAEDAVLENYLASPTEEILILDEYLPYSKAVHNNERLKNILFIVYPSKRGGWNVQTVPKEMGQFVNRMDFPEEWLGHADPERGIHFAHTANFLIACDTKEQAEALSAECTGKTVTVTSAETKQKKEERPLLHSLTSLQQEANVAQEAVEAGSESTRLAYSI